MKTHHFDINPVAKPRMTRRDAWKKRDIVLKYFAFKDEVRLKGVRLPDHYFEVTFIVEMPKSWSAKKRALNNGQPHTQRPDLDNMVKALLDAVAEEDSHFHHYKVKKIWGLVGSIKITF